MDAGFTTLMEIGGVQGFDPEERLDQRQIEVQWFIDRGLTPPSWAAMNVGAEVAAQPPEAPKAK